MFGSLFIVVLCSALGTYFLLNQPRFGDSPQGERLDIIEKSPNYVGNEFNNLIPTPKFSKDTSTFAIIWKSLAEPKERLVPEKPLPAVKTDLKALDRADDVVIWLGHSSYFIQLGGKRILLDPVFSDYAAPFRFFNKAFPGTSLYRAEDIPAIDYLLISHDHWDHLDYATVKALQNKVRHVVCPLGVGSYFEGWGYVADKIFEADWYEQISPTENFTIHVLPARHYSGRLFRQNRTLWAGFALESGSRRLFFSGDSGYGPHFAEIGRRFGRFDFVALDCGQYDDRWSYIHMTPEEAAIAASDLNADAFLPAHVGRFSIARHAWDDPFIRVAAASEDRHFKLLTPLIGEPVNLDNRMQRFTRWWQDLETDSAEIPVAVSSTQ